MCGKSAIAIGGMDCIKQIQLTSLLLVAFLVSQTVFGIQILDETQVKSVKNGTDVGIALDCRYQIEGNDTKGLVVKWFYNDRPKPVYQWIVGNKAQDIGILQNRLDLSYKVSSSEFLEHRALFIKRPTTELSGKYTCVVFNWNKEHRMETVLVVYAVATDFNMSVNSNEENMDTISVECFAEGLFPEPQIELIQSGERGSKTHVNDAEIEISLDSETNTYTIHLVKTYKTAVLEQTVDFACSLTIANTDYRDAKRITHVAMNNLRTTDPYFPEPTNASEILSPTKNETDFLVSSRNTTIELDSSFENQTETKSGGPSTSCFMSLFIHLGLTALLILK